MSETAESVEMIPIAQITVLNPRARNRRVFEELDFATLLRAEGLTTMPKPLAERLNR